MNRIFNIDNKVVFIVCEKKLIRLSDDYMVKLRAPAAFCFSALLENQGNLVSHKDLFYLAWECFGMSASLNVLHNTIFYLRRYLSKMGFENNIIQNIPRRGFAMSNHIIVKKGFSDEPFNGNTMLSENNDGLTSVDYSSVSSEINESCQSQKILNFTSLSNIDEVEDGRDNAVNEKLKLLEVENSILKKLLSEAILSNEELKIALMRK